MKVSLLVECDVECDPRWEDDDDSTLKHVAKSVLASAMDDYSDRFVGDNGFEFKCLAGTVTMRLPKIVGEDEG